MPNAKVEPPTGSNTAQAAEHPLKAPQPQAANIVKATVLFADLRGFTSLAERTAPAQVLSRLQQFFGELLSAVENHGGEVFHVAGDCVMAGFTLRRHGQNGGRAALACGQAMLSRIAVLSERWKHETGVTTALGVGMHFGDVALGLLGPPRHEAWTLVGDTVNVAARLCDRVEPLPYKHLHSIVLRGRSAPVDIWCWPATERVWT